MDDNGTNKNDEMYSHLDDIDEFFLKNFNILLTEKKNALPHDVEILDINDIKSNENTKQPLNLDIDTPKPKREILDIDDLPHTEILEMDNTSPLEVLDDNFFTEDRENLVNKDEQIEILDNINTHLNEDEKTIISNTPVYEDVDEGQIYHIKETEENIFNNIDADSYQNATYYKKSINTKKVKSKQKIILFILLILIFISLTFVIMKLIKWKLDNDDIKNQLQNLQNSVVKEEVSNNDNVAVNPNNVSNSQVDDVYLNIPLVSVDIANLKKQNSDTIGWLKVNGTNIDYPVVQASDNEYYLTHAFNHNYNEAGWIFADYRNNLVDDKNLVIYGHARLNSTMFGTLKNVVKPFWYNDINNYVINFSMYDYNTSWLVFSTYIADNEKYYIKTSFSSDDEYMNFLNTIKSRSVYNYNIDINENDHIMTLSTCYTNDKRIVLHAKLIKREKR